MTRARLVAVGAALALAAGLTGCGQNEGITRGGSVIGGTLTVYSLVADIDSTRSRDVIDGERLALSQAGGKAGAFKVNFASLDETGGATGDELRGAVAASTREAISDPQVIAVIGDLADATARVSVPLLNSAGILHVSPGVTDPGFVSAAGPGEPEVWYPAGPRTFFPLTPDVDAQARALAQELTGKVLVEQEASASGQRFARALRSALGASRLVASAAAADAAVYAGDEVRSAQGVIEGLRREAPDLTVTLPAALAGTSVAQGANVRALSSVPAPDAAFGRTFSDAFGRAATPAALQGYAAMRRVLAAIDAAGAGATSRQRVIDAFRETGGPAPKLYELRSENGQLRARGLASATR